MAAEGRLLTDTDTNTKEGETIYLPEYSSLTPILAPVPKGRKCFIDSDNEEIRIDGFGGWIPLGKFPNNLSEPPEQSDFFEEVQNRIAAEPGSGIGFEFWVSQMAQDTHFWVAFMRIVGSGTTNGRHISDDPADHFLVKISYGSDGTLNVRRASFQTDVKDSENGWLVSDEPEVFFNADYNPAGHFLTFSYPQASSGAQTFGLFQVGSDDDKGDVISTDINIDYDLGTLLDNKEFAIMIMGNPGSSATLKRAKIMSD